MTERVMEDAYFYLVDRDLIEKLHQSLHRPQERIRPTFNRQTQATNQKTFYDFLNERFQPDAHWRADIMF